MMTAERKALRGVSVNAAQQATTPDSGEHRLSSEGEINQGAVRR